jgi:hypothetical protein
MYRQKEISEKLYKKKIFVHILKVTDGKSRIRIRIWIRNKISKIRNTVFFIMDGIQLPDDADV